MLLTLVMAAMTQFPVIVEQQEPVFYGQPTVTYQYSVPVVRTGPIARYSPYVGFYSLPADYYLTADPFVAVNPFVRVYPPYFGGRTIIKERGLGFRRTIIRY